MFIVTVILDAAVKYPAGNVMLLLIVDVPKADILKSVPFVPETVAIVPPEFVAVNSELKQSIELAAKLTVGKGFMLMFALPVMLLTQLVLVLVASTV